MNKRINRAVCVSHRENQTLIGLYWQDFEDGKWSDLKEVGIEVLSMLGADTHTRALAVLSSDRWHIRINGDTYLNVCDVMQDAWAQFDAIVDSPNPSQTLVSRQIIGDAPIIHTTL